MPIIKDNIEYYLYDEIKRLIILELRQELLDKAEQTGHKYIGDINKVGFSKALIGRKLEAKGYNKKLILINKVKKLYYYYDIQLNLTGTL